MREAMRIESSMHVATHFTSGEGSSVKQVRREAAHCRQVDRREYRALMAFSVTFFLLVSVVTRVLPRGLRPLATTSKERESCIQEARRAALAVVPYAFEW